MSRAIWKFDCPQQSQFTLFTMPAGAQILHVAEQHGIPRLWAIVETEAEAEPRYFRWYATGETLPDNPGTYIGTLQTGPFVFHLFEVTE